VPVAESLRENWQQLGDTLGGRFLGSTGELDVGLEEPDVDQAVHGAPDLGCRIDDGEDVMDFEAHRGSTGAGGALGK
jgi:hypothetical protein